MLVEFSVRNFRSIRDKVTLSLVASPDKTRPENTFTVAGGKLTLLKTAAIYGANASGKSNVIEALRAMRRFVRESHKQQRGDAIGVTPFRLDREWEAQPTEFEAVFVKEGMRYVYGFSADRERVYEEWLRETDLGGGRAASRRLFQREMLSSGRYEWAFGERWKPKIRGLEDQTLENALYLSQAVRSNHPKASLVFDWFGDTLRSVSSVPQSASETSFTADLCDKKPDVKARIQMMLKDADLGIEDFYCKKEPLLASPEWLNTPESVRNRILEDLGSKADKLVVGKVVTKHVMSDGDARVDFDLMEDESAGTIRLFSLAGPLVESMMNDRIIFCDELDSSLHPMLTRALVSTVHQSDTRFQLIFTTHDCSLLDADIFRRDQIWFTEKNEKMATDLYSLSDIKPRAAENFRKGYLSGRYGAIPFVGEFTF